MKNPKRLKCFVTIIIVFLVSGGLLAENKRAESLYKESRRLQKAKKYSLALKKSLAAESESPTVGRYTAWTGFVHYSLKEYDRALLALNRALRNNYKEPWVYLTIARSYYGLKKIEPLFTASAVAVKSAQKKEKLERFKNNAEYRKSLRRVAATAYDLRAFVYYKKDKLKAAINSANKAYQVFPEYSNARLTRTKAHSLAWLAHIQLGKGDFKKAAQLYERGAKALVRNRNKNIIQAHLIRIKQLARLSRLLRDRPPSKPVYIHKLLGIFIEKIDVEFTGPKMGFFRGKTRMKERHRRRQKIIQLVMKRWMEAASGGKFSLSFKNVNLNSELREIKAYMTPGNPNERHRPEIESLIPYPTDLLYRNRNKFDTFIFYWNGEGGISTSAHGGAANIPFVPYQLYGQRRGRLLLPSNWSDNPVSLSYLSIMHEYFHTIEMMAHIRPLHGFRKNNRRLFGGWKGEDELEYYLWHFKNTLPRVNKKTFRKKPQSWKNFNFRFLRPDHILKKIVNVNKPLVSKLSLNRMGRAWRLYEKASRQLKKGRKSKGKKLLLAAFRENPYQPTVLSKLASIAIQKKEYELARKYYLTLAEYRPGPRNLRYLANLLQFQLKRPEQSIPYYRRILKGYPDYSDINSVRLYLGRALIKQEKYNESVNVLEDCRVNSDKKRNDYLQCTFWKGYVFGEKLNQKQKASDLIREAVSGGLKTRFTNWYYKKYVSGRQRGNAPP